MNNTNQIQGYAIQFLDLENKPLAYCNVEILVNDHPITDTSLLADKEGMLVFHPSFIEQGGENLRLKVTFWNDKYPKTKHSEVPEFTWVRGMRKVRLRVYNVYEITPRSIPNENNEKAEYSRPIHIVKRGDTWDLIEKKTGIDRYLLLWENQLDEAMPIETLVGQALYFPKGMRKNQSKSKQLKDNSSKNESKKENKQDKGDVSLSNSQPKSENGKTTKSSEDKKDKNDVLQERSENNGKPVDKVDKECPDECKVAEIIIFKTSKGNYIISKELWDFILNIEKYVATPYVPSNGGDGKSGVTLGYGYDLGQQTKSTMYDELSTFYTPEQLKRLEIALGIKGIKAYELSHSLRDITITKENAKKLAVIVKQRYAELVVSIYPEILNYHPHCQGVLLSLVYNRGSSLDGPSRREMKDIQNVLKVDNAYEIPSLLRSMKRLWTTTKNRGVAIRREEEAKWFEKGVKCDRF